MYNSSAWTAGSSAIQGTNARKVISEVYALFVLQCTAVGGKVNTRRLSQPCHSLTWNPFSQKIIYEIFWS